MLLFSGFQHTVPCFSSNLASSETYIYSMMHLPGTETERGGILVKTDYRKVLEVGSGEVKSG